MDSVVNLGKKVSESTSDFIGGIRDTLRDRRSFTNMDAPCHVTKMNIPQSYDDPQRDAIDVRRKLDDELKQERERTRKSSSGEFRRSQASTCVPTPERQFSISRSASGISETKHKSRSKVAARDVTPDPFANFADFEQSPLQTPHEAALVDNPFKLEEHTDVLVSQLCNLSSDDFSAVLARVIKHKPSHSKIIHNAVNHPYL